MFDFSLKIAIMEKNERFWGEFIDIYHEHPCLWEVKSKDYANKHKRNAAYGILLEKYKQINTNATMEVLKNKINKMRTAFRRELKKVQESKSTDSGGDIYEPSLRYYNLLLFTAQSKSGRTGKSTDEEEGAIYNKTQDNMEECEYEETEAPLSPISYTTHVRELVTPLDSEENTPETQTSTYDNTQRIPTPPTSRSQSRASSDIHKTQTPSKNRSPSRTSHDGRKKKKIDPVEQRKLNSLNLAEPALTTDDEEYMIAGKRIGYQLKGIAENQRIIADKLISDVIYFAKIGKLTEHATVNCTAFANSAYDSSTLQPTTYQFQTLGHPPPVSRQSRSYIDLQPPSTITQDYPVSQVESMNSSNMQGDTQNVRYFLSNYNYEQQE